MLAVLTVKGNGLQLSDRAMKGKKGLEPIYAKNVLFDFSYKNFYRDGFGKDYRILNLADDSDEERRRLYLTDCLVAF